MIESEEMIKDLKELYSKKGYVFRDNINIFGFRDSVDQDKDVWNDYIGVCFPETGRLFLFSGTTDPSKYYTENPYEGTEGAMHLCLGQYPEAYCVGNHMGRLALCQWGASVKVWRDSDKDYRFVKGKDFEDNNSWNGTNIHYPGKGAEEFIKYSSAGCQVIKPDEEDYYLQWEYFFRLVRDAMEHYELKYVDYTLFNMDDLPTQIDKNKYLILDLG